MFSVAAKIKESFLLGSPLCCPRPQLSPMRKVKILGHLGFKTNQGFYSYPNPTYTHDSFLSGTEAGAVQSDKKSRT